jgi:hypothetical protein
VAFDLGATPEEIVQRYPSVDIASAYALIAYVLRNRESVDLYMADRAKAALEVQTEVESRFPPDGLRARLLARRATEQRFASLPTRTSTTTWCAPCDGASRT